MSEKLELEIGTKGEASAKRALDATRKALGDTARAGEQASQQQARAAQAAAAASQTAARTAATAGQQGAQAFQQIGTAVSRLAPEMSGLTSAVGSLGSAFGGLTGALGPVGVAAAAAGLAITAITSSMATSRAEADRYTRSLQSTVGNLESFISLQRDAARLQRQQQEIDLGVADPETQRAAANRAGAQTGELRARERQLRARLRSAESGSLSDRAQAGGISENLERVQSQLARAEAESQRLGSLYAQSLADARDQVLQETEEMVEAANRPTGGGRAGGGGRRSASDADAGLSPEGKAKQDAAAAQEAMLERERETQEEILRIREASQEAQNQLRDAFAESDQRALDAEVERRRRADEQLTELREKQKNEVEASQNKVAQIEQQMWDSMASTVLDAAGQAFKFIIEGNENAGEAFLELLESFLQATFVEHSIKALAEAANAVAAAASLNPLTAATHATAAGMHAAVAAATGLGAVAVSAARGGGGDSSPSAAATPSGASSGGGGGEGVTVNLFAPNAVMTDAERGALITGSQRALRRQRGRGAGRVGS